MTSFSVARTPFGEVEYIFEGSSGPLLIGMHGSPGSCRQADGLMSRLGLTAENCRKLSFSRPGYCGTPLSSGRSWDEQADLLNALLDQLDLPGPVILFGFSGGGVAALEFARHTPRRVAKLLLLSPVTGPFEMFGHTLPKRLLSRIVFSSPTFAFAQLMLRLHPRTVLRSMLHDMSLLRGTPLRQELARLESTPDDREFLLDSLRECIPFSTVKQGVWNDDCNVRSSHAIDTPPACPILLLHGTLDANVPSSQSRKLARLTPGNSELILVPNGGHMLTVEPCLPELRRTVARFCL